MPLSNSLQTHGTVYGTLLNHRDALAALGDQVHAAPYKAPPKAPVLYIKPRNTWAEPGAAVVAPADAPELEMGATLGLVIGAHAQVVGAVLLGDWSVPHTSYYRPPVKFRCRDGFLALPQHVSHGRVQDWATLKIEVRRNRQQVQSVDLQNLMRAMPKLLDDVGDFMTLQPGDVLMVGTDCLADGSRPRAKPGDRVEISAPGFASVVTTVKGQP